MGWLALVVLAVVCVGGYAWFEAGWLRTRVLDVELPDLPTELDGLRIGHLSDLPGDQRGGARGRLGRGAGARSRRDHG
jgi:predicted MPP superfamily phosphohydrolase